MNFRFHILSLLLLIGLAMLPMSLLHAIEDSAQLPSSLAAYRNVHPRLFLTPEKAEELRKNVHGSFQPIWAEFIRKVDKIAATKPTPYTADPGEQLWQRGVGSNISDLAMAWIISGDKKYLNAAVDWAKASCSYPTWGLIPNVQDASKGLYTLDSKIELKPGEYHSAEFGLAYGHQLLGLAMLYDYAYHDLNPATRELIYTTMVARAKTAYPNIRVNYNKLQNHTWINHAGLLAVGLAVFDQEPAAAQWINCSQRIIEESNAMLPIDGASQEGFGYWGYGMDWFIKLMKLSEPIHPAPYVGPWWDHTADYCTYMLLPRNSWTKTSHQNDYNDAKRYMYSDDASILRYLAARNRDEGAQWLADELEQSGVMPDKSTDWLNLLCYDPTLKAVRPENKPTFHHFEDMGLVCARTSWSGDESVLYFRSGYQAGKNAQTHFANELRPGDAGHVHHDDNHFSLFGCGEWLIRNSTYANRDAELHNTLVVDGIGQYLDVSANGFLPPPTSPDHGIITEATSTPDLDRITGDATAAYPAQAGLKSFVRHLLFVKPNVLIVADDIKVDQAKNFTLYFHPENKPILQPDKSYLMTGESAQLQMNLLTPKGIQTAIIEQKLNTSKNSVPNLTAITLQKSALQWRNIVAFAWCKKGEKPTAITMKQRGDVSSFQIGDRFVELNWAVAPPMAQPNR